MEAEGESTPSKPSKTTSSAQETPTAPSYPDWSGSMQAYYNGAAPPPFFASPMASPSPHPYVWGGQHPLISPYGTPVPYPAIYPPGGVYAHPNMVVTTKAAQGSEFEGKSQDSKDTASAKKSKGNSDLGSSKAGDNGRAASGSGNGGASQSAESGSDESLDASDENNNQELASSKKGSFNQMLADGATAQNSDVGASIQTSVPGKSVVSMPATNLNIGMGLWNGSPAGTMKMRPDGVPSVAQDHQWIQDERELKRQKRKQSNRESARRSRLRKQAECEELQRRVESLSGENQSLTQELQRLAEDCNKLTAENTSIKEELTQLYGPEILVNLDGDNPTSGRSQGGCKGNS